jgi:hypothetical protein
MAEDRWLRVLNLGPTEFNRRGDDLSRERSQSAVCNHGGFNQWFTDSNHKDHKAHKGRTEAVIQTEFEADEFAYVSRANL